MPPLLGVLGAWMTFKKAEMAKTLRNGLSMIETNPLNHIWSDLVILLGLSLNRFQKKLLLNRYLKWLLTYLVSKFMNPNGKIGLLTYHACCSLLRCIDTYEHFVVKGVSDLETSMYLALPERSCSCGIMNFSA